MSAEQLTRKQWDTISAELRAPFDPGDVDFRIQGKANEQTGRAQVVAYVDARAVQDRLDEVVGAGNWSFDWQPLVIEKGEVQVAKGTLALFGVAKADVGTASNFQETLGAVSHCFKRAAVQWGVGRYLYNLHTVWVTVEKSGGRIPDAVLRELRAKLPRPGHVQPPHVAIVPEDEAAAEPEAVTDEERWNPLEDLDFKRRCKAIGLGTQNSVQRMVERAGGYQFGTPYPLEKQRVLDVLADEERKAQVRAKAAAAAAAADEVAASGDLAQVQPQHVRP